MAFILSITSWIFCLRPITWLIEKIFKKAYKARAILIELHYLLLSVFYFLLFVLSFSQLASDEVGLGIFMLLIGLFGTLGLGFGIFHYHKSVNDMTSEEYKYTEFSYNSYSDTVSARDKYKTTFTASAFKAVLCSPLNPIIRLVNIIITIVYLSKPNWYCDLAVGIHPDTDSDYKKIFCDNFYYVP